MVNTARFAGRPLLLLYIDYGGYGYSEVIKYYLTVMLYIIIDDKIYFPIKYCIVYTATLLLDNGELKFR